MTSQTRNSLSPRQYNTRHDHKINRHDSFISYFRIKWSYRANKCLDTTYIKKLKVRLRILTQKFNLIPTKLKNASYSREIRYLRVLWHFIQPRWVRAVWATAPAKETHILSSQLGKKSEKSHKYINLNLLSSFYFLFYGNNYEVNLKWSLLLKRYVMNEAISGIPGIIESPDISRGRLRRPYRSQSPPTWIDTFPIELVIKQVPTTNNDTSIILTFNLSQFTSVLL